MKQTAWVMGVVLGAMGCSGTYVGGDAAGGAAGLSAPQGTADGAILFVDVGGAAGGPVANAGADAGGAPSAGPLACAPNLDAWLAFDSDAADFNRDIYVIRADGTQQTRLTTDSSVDKQPYFSPDGRLLSFTSDRSGSLQIYVMDLADHSVRQLTHLTEGADESSFSANGELIAFHSGKSVYTIRRDGSGQQLVASGLDNFNAYFRPRFIGDEQLVFDRNNEINAAQVDSGILRNIVANTTIMIKSPSVAPQGNEIAYSAQCGIGSASEGFSIWTTAANTSTMACAGRRVTASGDLFNNNHPAWGPQNTIAYDRVDPATSLGRITLIGRSAGSTPCMITSSADDSLNPSWSPEGLEL